MMIENLLPFVKEIDRLKTIDRQTPIHVGGRVENTAEHSWHLAMTVLVFEKMSPVKLDINKAVKMALLHDIVEIDAGDVIIYGDQSSKKAKEALARERIFGLLPAEIGEDFKALWNEFEEGQCAEAKFVSAIDRFLPLYSNYLNGGYSWKNHNVKAGTVINKCEPPIASGLPELWTVAKKMIDESIASGNLQV
ncbi:phosphohydrolase [Bdellovibrio sp. qaytius]|nr:phosphohydrolase [Bdellovibrio sp. qaytius]